MDTTTSQTKGQIHTESQKVIERKMQKIITALYLVTDLIPEQDPLRRMLRSGAVRASYLIRGLTTQNPSNAQKSIAEAEMHIGQTLNLLETAVSVGFVSDMNFKILSSALVGIENELSKRFALFAETSYQTALSYNRPVQDFTFSKEMIDDLGFTQGGDRQISQDKRHIGQNIKDNTKDIIKDKPVTPINKPFIPKENKVIPRKDSGELGSRETELLGIVAEKGTVSVSDLTQNFPEISEKTIQRMLLRLTELGRLSKEGEKRWSRYSLAS